MPEEYILIMFISREGNEIPSGGGRRRDQSRNASARRFAGRTVTKSKFAFVNHTPLNARNFEMGDERSKAAAAGRRHCCVGCDAEPSARIPEAASSLLLPGNAGFKGGFGTTGTARFVGKKSEARRLYAQINQINIAAAGSE